MSSPRRPAGWIAAVLLVITVVAASCSSARQPELGPPSSSTASEDVSTTAPGSAAGGARVTIGGASYEVEVVCYDAGAGEVVAIGRGTTDAGDAIDLLVEAFTGEPYVGLHVGGPGDLVYESALDTPLELFVDDDRIVGGAIHFVTELDLATGQGKDAGVGSVEVVCGGYERGLPEGY